MDSLSLLHRIWNVIGPCPYKFYSGWRSLRALALLVEPVSVPKPLLMLPGFNRNCFTIMSLIVMVTFPDVTSTVPPAGKLVICREAVSKSPATNFAGVFPHNGSGMDTGMGRNGFENFKRYTDWYCRSSFPLLRGLGDSSGLTLTALAEVSMTFRAGTLDCKSVNLAEKPNSFANSCVELKRNLTSAVREYTGHLLRSDFAIAVYNLAVSNRATAASLFNLETSTSFIICNRLPHKKIPPSAISSPATPKTTKNAQNPLCFLKNEAVACGRRFSNSSKNLFVFLDIGDFFASWSALTSPYSPTSSTTPNTNNHASEVSSPATTYDLDNDKNIPISIYDLAGALGFALQGVCILIIFSMRQNRK
jgi:hypothetical protein